MHANHREEVDSASAGDIVAAVGLKSTLTGDTLCAPEAPILLEAISFPEPVVSVAVEPGASRQMEEALNLVGRVSPSPATVLILGESGTGKDLIAKVQGVVGQETAAQLNQLESDVNQADKESVTKGLGSLLGN
jgi:elongation factor G